MVVVTGYHILFLQRILVLLEFLKSLFVIKGNNTR